MRDSGKVPAETGQRVDRDRRRADAGSAKETEPPSGIDAPRFVRGCAAGVAGSELFCRASRQDHHLSEADRGRGCRSGRYEEDRERCGMA